MTQAQSEKRFDHVGHYSIMLVRFVGGKCNLVKLVPSALNYLVSGISFWTQVVWKLYRCGQGTKVVESKVRPW